MKSLRSLLIWHLLVGGILLLGVAGFALHWQARRALTAEFDAGLHIALQSLATLTELEKDGNIAIEGGIENLMEFNRPNAGQVFVISHADGREIARSRSLGSASLPPRAGSHDNPEFFDVQIRADLTVRCAGMRFLPRLEDEERVATGPQTEAVLVLGRDRGTVDRSLAALRTALVVTGATMMALFAVLVAWGVHRGLLPVRHLGEAVAEVNSATLATRFGIDPLPAELRPIAERLNDLLARLELSFARERRFSATAAHELRTPLAELHTLAEVNLSTPSSEAERIESWKDALASTKRMESLALHLLALTRAEDAQHVVQNVRVLVAEAIAAAWTPHEDEARRRGVRLQVSVPADLALSSDPVLLGVVLGNLCGNAVAHAPGGSEFSILAEKRGGTVAFHFRNRTDALEEKDMAHLFERFWRKDAARSDGSHHGLGLSVARQFANLLGGSLSARIHHETGGDEVELVLSLPCAT